MNTSPLASYAPIFIAYAEGYFEDEGIELELVSVNRSAEAMPLLISGDLDVIGSGTNAGMLNILASEPNIKVVADRGTIFASDECAYTGIVFSKALYESGELTGPEDLEGRVIAGNILSATGFMLGEYLAQAGLTFDDIEDQRIPQSSYVDALANGAVDAIITPEPWLTRLVEEGVAVLGASGHEVHGDFQSSILTFGPRLLVEDRELGIRFLKAYLRGIEQYNEGKTDRNVEIIVEYTGEDEALVRNSCWVSIDPEGRIDFSATEPFQQFLVDLGEMDNPITEAQFWDPSLLEEALQQLDE